MIRSFFIRHKEVQTGGRHDFERQLLLGVTRHGLPQCWPRTWQYQPRTHPEPEHRPRRTSTGRLLRTPGGSPFSWVLPMMPMRGRASCQRPYRSKGGTASLKTRQRWSVFRSS